MIKVEGAILWQSVITNGEYYIYLNEQGKHRKTKDISQALQYKSVREAIDYMYKAPAKTKGFLRV